MQRLLILSCSQRKRSDPGLLPAIGRYDGPAFRVLRRYRQSDPVDPPQVYVLSAEFGLIAADRPIPTYDRRMTPSRADDLRRSVAGEIHRIFGAFQLTTVDPTRVLVHVGQDYLRVLGDTNKPLAVLLASRVVPGGQGAKLARLRDWLYGAGTVAPACPDHLEEPAQVRLRRVELSMTTAEALEVARRSVRAGNPAMNRWQAWYVPLDGQRVAPKWFVSCLTGVEVGRFTTSDALNLLARLGIEVKRA